MFGDVPCLLMLIFVRKRKRACLFYLSWYMCFNLRALESSTKSCSTKCSSEAAVQSCSMKEVFLEIYQNSQENTCARVSFFIKLQIKEVLAQVFSC